MSERTFPHTRSEFILHVANATPDAFTVYPQVTTTLGELVGDLDTSLLGIALDTRVTHQMIDTPYFTFYSLSLPDVEFKGDSLELLLESALNTEPYKVTQGKSGALADYREILDSQDGQLAKFHGRFLGTDWEEFVSGELSSLYNALKSPSAEAMRAIFDSWSKWQFASRSYVVDHFQEFMTFLNENNPYYRAGYYEEFGYALYNYILFRSPKLGEWIQAEGLGVSREEFYQEDRDAARKIFGQRGQEIIKRAPKEIIEEIMLPDRVDTFFIPTPGYRIIDDRRDPYTLICYQANEHYLSPSISYMGNNIVRMQFHNSFRDFQLQGMESTVIDEYFSDNEEDALTPWVLYAIDKGGLGQSNMVLGDVPDVLRQGIPSNANRTVGNLFLCSLLSSEQRNMLIPRAMKLGKRQQRILDAQVGLAAQMVASEIIDASEVTLQAEKAQ